MLVPVLGEGTWHMGEHPSQRADEIAALRLGLELGLTLIDTAEIYGYGASEALVAEAIGGGRDGVFLVSKVPPEHATLPRLVIACEGSLRRLKTDRIDLYLLHWREERTPLAEAIQAFELLRAAGKIRDWGVSNFDITDMEEVGSLTGGIGLATDQVLYNLEARGIEWDLIPWCQRHRIPIMAYSPIGQGALVEDEDVIEVARRLQATPAQVALAWVLRQDGVIGIPKAGTPQHVRENVGALSLRLTADDIAQLDRAFRPPIGPQPLEVI
jgi:diketogulonate reductase-like aldo/keto reductase